MIKIVENIKDFQEENNNIQKCITHSGIIHADESFCTVVLDEIFDNIVLFRTHIIREAENIIVFDIGNGEYDHHQRDRKLRVDGTPYSSFGLIWEKFGIEYIKKHIGSSSLNNINIDLQKVSDTVEKDLVIIVDKHDNGIEKSEICSFIAMNNPTWLQKQSSTTTFLRIVEIAKNILNTYIDSAIAKVYAECEIEKYAQKAENGIMVLENGGMPWKEYILTHTEYNNILYVVHPGIRNDFCITAVPLSSEKLMDQRKPLPEIWRGKTPEELQKLTGVHSFTFCHNSGFLVSCGTLEDAIKIANIAVSY